MTDELRPGDPRELGGYQLLGRLGQGGMGAVYLGRAPGGRLVAVKAIRPEYATEPEFRARFRSEVNRARQVPPFCTAEVLDADPDHPTPYLVVEYVDGPSLARVIAEQGPLGAGRLHSVAVGVATALAAIHGAGVIHRDLKPANVLFALGTPKVIDFGIARAFEATSQHTRTDQMVGTVAYMAPERFDTDRGQAVGPAADVFAWGAVVTYAGTGRTPFQADSAAATAGRILTQPPDLTGLPEPLQRLVAMTLAKDPRERPTAHELLDLLLAAEPTGATGQPELRRVAEAARRTRRAPAGGARSRRRVAVVAALLVAALVGAGLFAAPAARRVLASMGMDRYTPTPSITVPSAPGPSASASRPRVRAVHGPKVIDRLDRPGQWSVGKDAGGACLFQRERLEVNTGRTNEYRCRGPADIFGGDQSISVTAVVLSAGACAAIWFRAVDAGAYRVTLCERFTRLGVDNGTEMSGEVRAAVTSAVGQPRTVLITVLGETATVAVDGNPLMSVPLEEPTLAAGQVVLGAINEASDGDTRAAFADAELRSLYVPPPVRGATDASPVPRYADLTKGDARTVVKLHAYSAEHRSAVVEPVIFMTGDGFCAAYKIKKGDPRCEEPWTTEESRTRVTVPVSAAPTLLTWDDGQGNVCIQSMAGGGTCPATSRDFAAWMTENPAGLVAITTRNATITSLAQIYTP